MGFLVGFLYVIHILCCVILIVVVLLHEAKGDSLATVFGGGGIDSAFGVRFGKKISHFTAGAAIVFMVLTIFLGLRANMMEGSKLVPDKPGVGRGIPAAPEETPPPETPDR